MSNNIAVTGGVVMALIGLFTYNLTVWAIGMLLIIVGLVIAHEEDMR